MTYRTMMVNLEVGRSNESLLRFSADLVERFGSSAIGIAACQPMQLAYGDSYVPGDLIEQDRAEIEKEMTEAEQSFRKAMQDRAKSLEWRSAIALVSMSDYVARQSRSVDLIVTGIGQADTLLNASRGVNTSDLVMHAGRPVLIAPASVDKLNLKSVVVGWKDTQETRRAIMDALPALKMAERVTVVEIAADEDLPDARKHVVDVVEWLKRHDIAAESLATLSTGDDSVSLDSIIQEKAAGLLVAGAYGHSRAREWVLGGVTRDLLLQARSCCTLVSH